MKCTVEKGHAEEAIIGKAKRTRYADRNGDARPIGTEPIPVGQCRRESSARHSQSFAAGARDRDRRNRTVKRGLSRSSCRWTARSWPKASSRWSPALPEHWISKWCYFAPTISRTTLMPGDDGYYAVNYDELIARVRDEAKEYLDKKMAEVKKLGRGEGLGGRQRRISPATRSSLWATRRRTA